MKVRQLVKLLQTKDQNLDVQVAIVSHQNNIVVMDMVGDAMALTKVLNELNPAGAKNVRVN
jgi:uncharacterized protein YlxW (UPF0749 family)